MSEFDGQNPPDGGGQTEQTNTPGPGPWAADLERFDESVRGDVDAYLRETWQPRVTGLEQQLSQRPESDVPEGLQAFYHDLGEDPETTMVEFLTQFHGEDTRPIWETALKYATAEEILEDPEAAAAQQGEALDEPTEYEVDLHPDDRQLLDEVEDERAEKAYNEAMKGLKSDKPDHFPEDWTLDQIGDVMAPYIESAPEELDDDEALAFAFERYSAAYSLIHGGEPGSEAARAEAAAGMTPEQIAAIEAEATGVPTVAGGTNPAIGQQKQYSGETAIADAVADFAREYSAKNNPAPPTV